MRHLERHPEPVPGCFGCKVLSVGASVGAPASPPVVEVPPPELHTRTARASHDPELRARLRGEFL